MSGREEVTARLAEHVVDRDGLVWRVVRDGGMATRAHFDGIVSIGIVVLDRDHGPLTTVAALVAEAVEDAIPEAGRPGETHTEWGVRWEDGETTSAGWMLGSESFARMSFEPRRGGRLIPERQPEALVRRERIVYLDRVGEWTEVVTLLSDPATPEERL